MVKSNPNRRWYLLLVLPYLALLVPSYYARATPMLFGIPFFYWYQFMWVAITAVLSAIVYFKIRAR